MMMMMMMMMTKRTTTIGIVLAVLIVATTSSTAAVYAQSTSILPTIPAVVGHDGSYVSVEDGYSVKLPSDWVVEDFDNAALSGTEANLNWVALASFCVETSSLPGIGGTDRCDLAQGTLDIGVTRFSDLQSRPDVAAALKAQNKTLNVSDMIPILIQQLSSDLQATNIKIVEENNGFVNVTNAAGQTIGTVPTKYVALTYDTLSNLDTARWFALLVLSPDGNTGYALSSGGHADLGQKAPQVVADIMNSFEVVQK
jgi:hypothetical protein